MDERNGNLLVMCGMSGLFSALFGTPVTATFFAMEVISVGVFYYSAIVPCFFSAVVALGISRLFGIVPVVYKIPVPEVNIVNVAFAMILGVGTALLSIIFCFSLHKLSKLLSSKIKNSYIRIFASGCVIVILTLIFGTDYNGAGMNIIMDAMTGTTRPEAFALKLVFTVITIAGGYKGGEIVPSFFIVRNAFRPAAAVHRRTGTCFAVLRSGKLPGNFSSSQYRTVRRRGNYLLCRRMLGKLYLVRLLRTLHGSEDNVFKASQQVHKQTYKIRSFPMEYAFSENTDIKVSRVRLGCMNFGKAGL